MPNKSFRLSPFKARSVSLYIGWGVVVFLIMVVTYLLGALSGVVSQTRALLPLFTPTIQWLSPDNVRVQNACDTLQFTEVENNFTHAVGNGKTLSYNGKLWVVGEGPSTIAEGKKVYYSLDGSTWTEAGTDALPFSVNSHAAVVFNNKMWLIGGTNMSTFGDSSRVYSSTDGSTWTLEGNLPFPLHLHTAAVHNGKIYVIGGQSNTTWNQRVLASSNGITWQDVGQFPYRVGRHAMLSYNGKLWVIGGLSPQDRKVMYSENGSSWAEAGTDSRPLRTEDTSAVVFEGKMWTIGGVYSAETVYSSTDGITWTPSGIPPYGMSGLNLGVEHGGKVWVVGGNNHRIMVGSCEGVTPSPSPTCIPPETPSPSVSPSISPSPSASPTPTPSTTYGLQYVTRNKVGSNVTVKVRRYIPSFYISQSHDICFSRSSSYVTHTGTCKTIGGYPNQWKEESITFPISYQQNGTNYVHLRRQGSTVKFVSYTVP